MCAVGSFAKPASRKRSSERRVQLRGVKSDKAPPTDPEPWNNAVRVGVNSVPNPEISYHNQQVANSARDSGQDLRGAGA